MKDNQDQEEKYAFMSVCICMVIGVCYETSMDTDIFSC